MLLTTNPGSHFGSSRTAGHDPLSTSSNPTGTSQYDSDTTGGASQGLKEPYASRMPGGFDNDDAATTASVRSGVPGQSQSRSAMTGANDPVSTDKPLPPEPTSGTYKLDIIISLCMSPQLDLVTSLMYTADFRTPIDRDRTRREQSHWY